MGPLNIGLFNVGLITGFQLTKRYITVVPISIWPFNMEQLTVGPLTILLSIWDHSLADYSL